MSKVIRGGIKDFHDIETARKIIMINIVSFIGIGNLVPLGIDAFRNNNPYLGIFDLVVAGILISLQVHLRTTGNDKISSHFGTVLTGCLFFYLYVTGGVAGSGHVWLFTFPLFSTFLLGAKRGTVAMILLSTAALGFPLVFSNLPFVTAYTPPFTLRLCMALVVTFSFAFFFERVREKTQGALSEKNIELQEKIRQLIMTENALVDSEEIYRNVVDGASDVIVLIRDNRIEYVNPQVTELTGYTAPQVQGTEWLRFVEPSEQERVADIYRLRMEGQSAPTRYESALRHKNGERIEVEINAKVLTLNGRPSDLVFIRDIREQKRAQMKSRQAREAAERANKAKSLFLANMSHELRTPLNHILGFTELVMSLGSENLTDQQAEYLSDVLESSQHLLSLINDILDLSKIEAGKVELEPSQTDIKALLEGSLVMIKEKALKRRMTLSTHIHNLPEFLMADGRKIKQIMFNLLSNAVKFTPPGGSISVTGAPISPAGIGDLHEQGTIEEPLPEALRGREWIRISVQDSGEGIEEGCLSLIFRPFEQLESRERKACEGTGLGLSLTKTLVELHGGRIWAESEGKGHGATFRFILPILSDADIKRLREYGGDRDEREEELRPS